MTNPTHDLELEQEAREALKLILSPKGLEVCDCGRCMNWLEAYQAGALAERERNREEIERLKSELDAVKAEMRRDMWLKWDRDIERLQTENDQLAKRAEKMTDALKYSQEQCSMDDPEFGNFTPLQFAARLGLIYMKCREALKAPSGRGSDE